jgi:type IV pilus assembly protein PilM
MAAGRLIGLDIGASSIRAVETRRRKDGQTVTNYGEAPLPAGAVVGGVVRDDKTVTAALRHLWSTARLRTRRVVLGVTNPQIVVREMSVTNLPRRELHQSLPFQVRDQLPLPVETAVLDFQPLEDPGTNETVRGLLVAAPRDAILTAVRAVERAGLHVERVDLASFALLRAAARLDDQVEAIVDIGGQATSVIVHTNGEPLIVRTIPRGGMEITEAISTRLAVTPHEAEAAKRQVGLHADRDTRVAEAVRDAVRPLVNEINSSFTYLTTSGRQTRVARVSLSGGGALLPGLLEELADQLSVDVHLVDPVARVHTAKRGRHDNLDRLRSSATVSVGLTLGAAR